VDLELLSVPRWSGLARCRLHPAGRHGHSLNVAVDIRQLEGPKPVLAAPAGLLGAVVPVLGPELCSTGMDHMEVAARDDFGRQSRNAHVGQEVGATAACESPVVAVGTMCSLALGCFLEEVFRRWVDRRHS
jgi:hypothetical protein